MPISRALLLKGLGGVAAVGAAAIGGYGIMKPNDFSDLFKSKKAIEGEKKNKADEINKKLKDLGLSEEVCKLDNSDFSNTTEYSKECELDKDKFQKIKFSNAGDTDVDVQGWTEENGKIKLSISNKSNGGIGFLFSGHPSNLTISKSSSDQTDKISIRSGKATEFELKDQKLSKVVDESFKEKLGKVNEKLGTLGLTDESCKFDVTEKDETLECGLDDAKLKAIKFSNKGSAESLTVSGSTSNLKIKVELGESNDPSFSFTGLSEDISIYGDTTKGKIVIKKEGDRKFRVLGEKLEKVPLNESALSAKLKKFNEKLSTLSLPDDCRFDVAEKDKVLECGLDEGKLKAIKFSNKPTSGDLTFSGTVPSGLKVKVEAKDNDADAHFTFTGLTQDLSIYGDSTKGKIVLKSSSASSPAKTFKEKEGKLEKVSGDSDKTLKLGAINGTLAGLYLPNKCRFDENEEDSSTECELSLDEFKAIKLTNKEDDTLNVSSDPTPTKMKLKVELKNMGNQGDETIYTLSDLDQKLKFGKSGEEITLVSGKPHEFEVRDSKLGPKRFLKTIDSGGAIIQLFTANCTYSDESSNKGTCKAKFMDLLYDVGSSEVVESITWDNKDECFQFWEYQENYSEKIKFTYKGTTRNTKNSKTSDRKLEQNKNYEMKKNDGFWKLKLKPDPQ